MILIALKHCSPLSLIVESLGMKAVILTKWQPTW